ncbi:ABC transporter permease subunit [Cognatiyoonia sp. IB215446]|uniref:ABC transporter permease n=1 Tax=Cognatiyoonia sp. IB215446 TaxID=3097355 RepID=UPI002A16083D|nr:ABC transporter permease subunit [Cognatiyoonia sp. IB215446]MDX8346937.1 ABC transporter permease subunit [Cognatiyoonia sp. IB215446]
MSELSVDGPAVVKDPLAAFGFRVGLALCCLGLMIGLALWLTPYDPAEADFLDRLTPPNAEHWFGTDHLGRDIGTRLMHGMVWSLGLSLIIATVGLIVGTTVGLAAARAGRVGDFALMRVTDSFFAFPELVAAVAFAGLFGPSTTNLVIALSIVSWMKFTRLARSLAHGLDERDFIIQARLNGLSSGLILSRHILPNVIPSLLVLWTNTWSRTILAVSGLSFLGFGVQPPTAEWGAMLLDGKPYMQSAPHVMIFPGVAVLISVLTINLVGDRLRDLVAATDRP